MTRIVYVCAPNFQQKATFVYVSAVLNAATVCSVNRWRYSLLDIHADAVIFSQDACIVIICFLSPYVNRHYEIIFEYYYYHYI